MTISVGLRSKVGLIAESTFGVQPTTPALQELPIDSFSINLTRDELADTSIRSDRMERYSLSGNRKVGGQINVKLAYQTFAPLFESAFQSTFTAGVLKVGTTRKSFTMEHAQLDIGQYTPYNGMIVDKFEISIPQNGIVTAKFDFVGKTQGAMATTSIDADGYTAPTLVTPYQGQNLSGFIKEGATTVGFVTALTISGDNGHASNYAIGSDSVRDFTSSLEKVTGQVTVFFEDAVMYNKFVNGTASSLEVKLHNGTNFTTILLPNIKYTGANKTISGSGPVTLTMPFKALFDTVTGTNIQITEG